MFSVFTMVSIEKVKMNAEFFQIFSLIFTLNRLSGLYPLTITYKKSSKLYKLQWSWLYCVLSITIIIAIASYSIFGFLQILALIKPEAFKITLMIVVTSMGVLACACFPILMLPFRRRLLFGILHNLQTIDGVFGPRSTLSDRKITVYFLSAVYFVYFLIAFFDGTLWYLISPTNFYYYCGIYVLYMVVIGYEFQYWQMVQEVRRRLRILNTILWKKYKRCYLEMDDVLKIIQVHDLIESVIDGINQWFCFGVSLHIVCSMSSFTLALYYFLFTLIHRPEPLDLLAIFVWVFIHGCRILVIVEVCQYCENEKNRTVQLVKAIMVLPLQKNVKEELKMFAMKLVYKKVTFSAYALPKLNRSMLMSMVGTITTFLVILLQFGS